MSLICRGFSLEDWYWSCCAWLVRDSCGFAGTPASNASSISSTCISVFCFQRFVLKVPGATVRRGELWVRNLEDVPHEEYASVKHFSEGPAGVLSSIVRGPVSSLTGGVGEVVVMGEKAMEVDLKTVVTKKEKMNFEVGSVSGSTKSLWTRHVRIGLSAAHQNFVGRTTSANLPISSNVISSS